MFGGRFGVSYTGAEYGCSNELEDRVIYKPPAEEWAFLYLAAQNFNLFRKIQNQNVKI
jgi:hypothetical protein